MMIPQKVADRLNEQVNHEYDAFWTYTAMAYQLESMDLKAFANWFSMQANEEKEHAEKIANYLLEQGAQVTLKSLAVPQSAFGTVQDVALITDRETGRPRGFGFVEMDAAGATAAIDGLNNKDFGGRDLSVNEARERNSGGGGGGGGYR